MSYPVLTQSRLRTGLWEFSLSSNAAPELIASHEGQVLPDLHCAPGPEAEIWRCSLSIPPAILNEGLQTIVIRTTDGTTIGSLAILSGEALADDIRAEVDLLRSELDLLKAVVRQYHHGR